MVHNIDKFVVYKITNKVNDKIYVGITTTGLSKRISSYSASSKSNLKNNKHVICKAMKKYGFENFIFETLSIASNKKQLIEMEIEWIQTLNSTDRAIGYNLSPGGFLHSEESLAKKSKALKGKPLSEDHKKKISLGLMGHSVSQKVIENSKLMAKKIAGWNRGTKGVSKPNSTSFKTGMSAPNKGRKKVIIDGKVRYIHDLQS